MRTDHDAYCEFCAKRRKVADWADHKLTIWADQNPTIVGRRHFTMRLCNRCAAEIIEWLLQEYDVKRP